MVLIQTTHEGLPFSNFSISDVIDLLSGLVKLLYHFLRLFVA